jgi:hypothetical protein
MTTRTAPTVKDLEMWPMIDDSSELFSLDYAESVQDLTSDDDCTEEYHAQNGWLFDLCEAYYALAIESERGSEILAQLKRMQFRMSPLFRD